MASKFAGIALAVIFMGSWSEASYITGTQFPFEGCVQNTMRSPYSATLYSYKENIPKQTSEYCVQLHAGQDCTPGTRDGKPTRCCDTHINKLKFFPAPDCRGSLKSVSITSKLMNRTAITSIYWEEHMGFDIVKITPLKDWLPNPAAVDGAVICINLKTPCWSLPMLSYDKEVLEYALYDKKVNNYECCPVGTLDVPMPAMPPYTPEEAGPGDSPAPSPSPKPSPSPSPSPKPSPSPSPKPSPSPTPSPKPSPSPPKPKRKRVRNNSG